MNETLQIGIIGDFDPSSRYHLATNDALSHAGKDLAIAVDYSWLPTPSLDIAGYETILERFDTLWCAPISPYKSKQGALKAIQFAREKDLPVIGT